ncbi:uncharacterized protein N7482_009006 [Penicillium canariense]|uniref:Uncharacterized protein n=1 Tax=Penicillium canariense TaxID=189055 RepID=A0A9W9HUU3_9EURO|nr:uncharacterized protein N7482_009006 [Penicillium canariense]KAJ5157906.1 hypothetical protein N7482_009006 [Penicillium canariense]
MSKLIRLRSWDQGSSPTELNSQLEPLPIIQREIGGFPWAHIALGLALAACLVGLFVAVLPTTLQSLTRLGGCITSESRLPPMMDGYWAIPLGLIWYGWPAQAHTHWIVPILGTRAFGVKVIMSFMSANTYMGDSNLIHAASVSVASTAVRSWSALFYLSQNHR